MLIPEAEIVFGNFVFILSIFVILYSSFKQKSKTIQQNLALKQQNKSY